MRNRDGWTGIGVGLLLGMILVTSVRWMHQKIVTRVVSIGAVDTTFSADAQRSLGKTEMMSQMYSTNRAAASIDQVARSARFTATGKTKICVVIEDTAKHADSWSPDSSIHIRMYDWRQKCRSYAVR